MTKSNIGFLAVLAVALPVLAFQFYQNNNLRQEIASFRDGGAGLDGDRGAEREILRSRDAEDKPATKNKNSDGVSGPGSLERILAGKDPMSRIRGLVDYVDGLAVSEIPGALENLRKRTGTEWDPQVRMLQHMMMTRWAQEDPEGAVASLNGLNYKRSAFESTSILGSIAVQDPKFAADWLADPDNAAASNGWTGRMLASTVGREWARQDPDAALAWAATLPDSQKAGGYGGVIGILAETDPVQASTVAMGLEPGSARNEVVGEIAKVWARSAPEDALDWAQSLEGTEQQRATQQAVGIWAQEDPVAVAGYLDRMEAETGPYLATVAMNWAPRAPEDAATWISTQPEGSGRNGAMGHVMWNWTTRDPEAAGEWLGTLPEGETRDAGIGGLAKAAFDFDPEGALVWTAQISDEQKRSSSVNSFVQRWVRNDPTAASQWANDNGVSIPEAPIRRGASSMGARKD